VSAEEDQDGGDGKNKERAGAVAGDINVEALQTFEHASENAQRKAEADRGADH
jgi:hypothetical protein